MKNMKKVVIVLLLIQIIFNFIFLNSSFAGNLDSSLSKSSLTKEDGGVPSDEIGTDIPEGEAAQTQGANVKTSLSFASFGNSAVGYVVGILARLVNVLIFVPADVVIGELTYSSENDALRFFITIDRLVYNRVPILNINYFDTSDTYKVGDLELDANESNKAIKENVAAVYYICRIVALILGLLVLVYIGIRMATSTVASEQAKYKKMIISWVESVFIIFLMPYIISFIINLGEMLTGMFYNLRNQILGAKTGETVRVFEEIVRSNTQGLIFSTSGLEVAMWSIFYWVLLYTEIKFLWTYTKRFFMTGFLIAISPLVTITYSIDKAGDGKAQAFGNWCKEFILNVLIQPLHALIYLVIVFTANNIAEISPIISIALLLSIGTVEKMVKVVFNINAITMRGIKEGLLKKKG